MKLRFKICSEPITAQCATTRPAEMLSFYPGVDKAGAAARSNGLCQAVIAKRCSFCTFFPLVLLAALVVAPGRSLRRPSAKMVRALTFTAQSRRNVQYRTLSPFQRAHVVRDPLYFGGHHQGKPARSDAGLRIIQPRLHHLYEWSVEELSEPKVLDLVRDGSPVYAFPFENRMCGNWSGQRKPSARFDVSSRDAS